jgi:MFS transporter, OFA family, oxalate/formate antiporter
LNDSEPNSQIASKEIPSSPPWFFYGWVVIGLSFATQGFHTAARISFSVFQVPLIDEFGWSRGALGGAFAFMMVIYAITGPFAGSRFERHGPRAVIPWGSVLIGIALAGGFFINSLLHVYILTGVFLGIGHALSGFSMHGSLIPRWFSKKRGLATGLSLSGAGVGALVLVPIVARMIEFYGWRMAYLFFGLALLLVLAPANFLLLRNRAQDMGLSLDGLSSNEPEEVPTFKSTEKKMMGTGEVFNSVRNDMQFWMLGLISFFIGIGNNTIMSQLQLYFVDAHYSMGSAAMVLGMSGFFRIGGSVVNGWVSDHLGRQNGLAISAALSAAGVMLLLSIPSLGSAPYLGYLFAIIFGFGGGGLSACFSALVSDTFKGPSLAVIMGILGISYGAGGALGPPLAGYTFDVVGSYFVPFSLIVLAFFAMILISLFGFKDRSKLSAR